MSTKVSQTDRTDAPETNDLSIGDQFELPAGTKLTVVGVAPASESPESASDGPLYEIEKDPVGTVDPRAKRLTKLYRPHDLDRALEAGADYLGRVEVENPTEPFWCDGCEFPTRGRERRSTWLVEATVCSYACREDVAAEQRRERIEDRD